MLRKISDAIKASALLRRKSTEKSLMQLSASDNFQLLCFSKSFFGCHDPLATIGRFPICSLLRIEGINKLSPVVLHDMRPLFGINVLPDKVGGSGIINLRAY